MFLQSKQEMINQRSSLQVEKMRLDKFFSMFLDKVGGRMDPDKTNTPEWKLYKAKMKEYGDLSTAIRTLDYRISVTHV